MIVTFNEYESDKKEFFRKHHNDFHVDVHGTSAENYAKNYNFSDGSTWYEVMTRKEICETVEVYKCNVRVKLDMFQTEYWNSDDSTSKFYFEPWNNNN